MTVSVIIPTYKRPGMLSRAIQSVLDQSYKDIEIIVVDDNDSSTKYRKETEKFMKTYANNNRIKYIRREQNGGGAAARNTGIKNATGEIIAFLDDDDEFLPKNISSQVENILKNNLDVSVCASITINEKKEIEAQKNYEDFFEYSDIMVYHLVKMLVGTQTFVIKKDLLEKINGFSVVPAGQEYVLMYRMIEAGAKVGVINKSLTNIYIHSGERITVGKNKIVGEKLLYSMKKKYFYKLSLNQKREVVYRYYSVIFGSYWKLGKKFKAFIYLFVSFFIKPIHTFKNFLSRIKNKTFGGQYDKNN